MIYCHNILKDRSLKNLKVTALWQLPFLFSKKEVRKMSKLACYYVENKLLERIYECRRTRKKIDNDIYRNISEDDEVIPVRINNYEERLSKGFKIFDMAKKGYPED
jgi:hypothetical protein